VSFRRACKIFVRWAAESRMLMGVAAVLAGGETFDYDRDASKWRCTA
jgi:hypothetical protein